MKLISMTDFAINQNSIVGDYRKTVFNYAKFLKQPLELGMFIPCDEENNFLEPPLHIELYEGDSYDSDCEKYQEAKSRVLFDGFGIVTDTYKSTKREFIHFPNSPIQIWRRLTYHTGRQECFFFDYYDKFKTIEDLIIYDLDLAVSF
jgi:hypothetical protein